MKSTFTPLADAVQQRCLATSGAQTATASAIRSTQWKAAPLTALAVASLLAAAHATAQTAAQTAPPNVQSAAERIEITAPAGRQKSSLTLRSEGLPTAVTTISRQEIERMNVGRDYTDLLRRVPGVNAYSFGQGDIGSPIKMRGFVGTGSHGGDVAVYIDGVPQNFPSANQGGPGMSDLSWLTAAMIERIEVIKGPFSALYGDQNRAGAVNIVTRRGGESSVGISVSSFSTVRATGVYSGQHGPFESFVVVEGYKTDGYRDNSGGNRGNVLAKVSTVAGDAVWSLRGTWYHGDWEAPGYLSFTGLLAGTLKPRDRDLNGPPQFGDATRYGVVLTRTPLSGEAGLHATVFVEHYEKRRAQSVGGNVNARNVQNDDRQVYGGRALHHFEFGNRASLALGAEVRADKGEGFNQRWDTVAGPGLNYNNNWGLDLLTYGIYAQGQLRLLDSLKAVGGVRADAFDYAIDNRKRPAASVSYNKSVVTPRAGLVWSPIRRLDIYANVGQGFRSPGERELSPPGAVGPLGAPGGTAFPDLAPPKLKSRDLGFKLQINPRWQLAGAVYRSINRAEIRETVPGSGNFASIGDTSRDGWELDGRVKATDTLAFTSSVGVVKGRINTPTVPGQTLIPGLPRTTARLGAEWSVTAMTLPVQINVDAFRISGAPYYVGSSPAPLFTRVYSRYDLRLSVDQGRWRYSAFATFQPKEFASEQAGATLDPRPKTDLGLALNYKF